MDLREMRDELSDHGFGDETETRLNAVLNDAYWDVCSRESWPFLEKSVTVTTTAGVDTITMPSDFGAAISLTDDANLIVLLPQRLDYIQKAIIGNTTMTGSPYFYYFVAGQIKLWPVPDTTYTYTLNYISVPAELVNDSDVPVLPQRHQRVIVLGALVDLYRMEDDPELAQVFEAQFEKRIGTMRNDLWMRQYDRTDMIFDMDSYDDFGVLP